MILTTEKKMLGTFSEKRSLQVLSVMVPSLMWVLVAWLALCVPIHRFSVQSYNIYEKTTIFMERKKHNIYGMQESMNSHTDGSTYVVYDYVTWHWYSDRYMHVNVNLFKHWSHPPLVETGIFFLASFTVEFYMLTVKWSIIDLSVRYWMMNVKS